MFPYLCKSGRWKVAVGYCFVFSVWVREMESSCRVLFCVQCWVREMESNCRVLFCVQCLGEGGGGLLIS